MICVCACNNKCAQDSTVFLAVITGVTGNTIIVVGTD